MTANQLATVITGMEGKKQPISVAQVAEVLRCLKDLSKEATPQEKKEMAQLLGLEAKPQPNKTTERRRR